MWVRTTKLYKVTYHDPEGQGVCIKGDIDAELWIGADNYVEVLALLGRQEITDEQIKNIEFVRDGVVLDDTDSFHEYYPIG
jgi:hypothetical protein